MRRTLAKILVATLAASLSALPAASQQARHGSYSLSAVAGLTDYDHTSALKDAPYVGIETAYRLTPHVEVGAYLQVARPTTDASFFPMLRLAFMDTVIHYLVSQQVFDVDVGVAAGVAVPLGPASLHVGAGAGRYMIRLDRQRSQRPTVVGEEVTGMSGWEYLLRASVSWRLGAGAAVRLGARDLIYSSFDREVLSLAEPMLSATNVPHPRPNPPEPKRTIHNLRYELGFSFTPRGAR